MKKKGRVAVGERGSEGSDSEYPSYLSLSGSKISASPVRLRSAEQLV